MGCRQETILSRNKSEVKNRGEHQHTVQMSPPLEFEDCYRESWLLLENCLPMKNSFQERPTIFGEMISLG